MSETESAAESKAEVAVEKEAAPEQQQEMTDSPASEPGSSLDEQLNEAYEKSVSPEKFEADQKAAEAAKEEQENTAKADDKTSEPEKKAEPEQETVEEQPEAPAIEPPLSWSKEAKEKWADIPPEAQQIIANREKDAHTAITKLGREVKAYEPLRDTLHQYREVFQANNIEPAQGVARLLEVQSLLDKDPVNGVREIAKAYKVDLAEFAYEDLQENAPEITSLQNEINELKQTLQSRERAEQERNQKLQQAQLEQMEDLVASFSAEKPHFEHLQSEIGINIEAIRAREPNIEPLQLLERAYQMALYQNESIRAELTKKQQQEAEQAAHEKARKAAEAASLNVNSSQSGTPVKRDLNEALDLAWERGTRA